MQETTLTPDNQDVYFPVEKIASNADLTSFFQEISKTQQFNRLYKLLNLPKALEEVMVQAFIHTSYVNESKIALLKSYERYEFVGDSVLQIISSKILFDKFTDYSEGQLSKLRSAIVNEETLSDIASSLGFRSCLILGNGARSLIVNEDHAVLADIFEAFLGILFIELGLIETTLIFNRMISIYENENQQLFDENRLDLFDPKSTLQEKCLEKFKELPVYKSEEVSHQSYRVSILLKDKLLISKIGNSKKKLEKALAKEILVKNILDRLFKSNDEEILC